MRLETKGEAPSSEPKNVFVLAVLGLSELVAHIESDSADLEAELSLRKLLFCFIGANVASPQSLH